MPKHNRREPQPQPRPRRAHRISLLVPYHGDGAERDRIWHWLQRYWRHELRGCEIIMGRDRASHHGKVPFSKTCAVNDAFRRSHGDIIVILDADAYLPGSVLHHCARRLRKARQVGKRLWFIPYTQLFRLTPTATERVLASRPEHPYRFPSPPDPDDVEDSSGSAWGRKFGAMIQIMPREAFETVGGMDSRFRGWGGEDVSFVRALDTLWAPHKTLVGDVVHLYHPKFRMGDVGDAYWKTRVWVGQHHPRVNDRLGNQYNRAAKHPDAMRKLVDEGHPHQSWWRRLKGHFRGWRL